MVKREDPKIRHARYYVRLAEENGNRLDLLDLEYQNIKAAANSCIQLQDWQLLTSLTTAINNYLLIRSRPDYIYFNASLITDDLKDQPAERVVRIHQLSKLEESRGNYAEALAFSQSLIPLYEQSGDLPATIETLQRVSRLSRVQGKDEEAYQSLEKGIVLARESGYRGGEVGLRHDCAILFEKRDPRRAKSFCYAAIEIARTFGYLREAIDLLILHAALLLGQCELQSAFCSAREALDIATRTNDIHRADDIRELLAKLGKLMEREVFISYNHQDRNFVERLAKDLKAAGLPVWWDQWEIKVGQSIPQKVFDAIDGSAYLIAVLSPHSVQSRWVQKEINVSLMKDLSNRGITILPLLAADCEIPKALRELKWADFRGDYGLGLRSLLDVLLDD